MDFSYGPGFRQINEIDNVETQEDIKEVIVENQDSSIEKPPPIVKKKNWTLMKGPKVEANVKTISQSKPPIVQKSPIKSTRSLSRPSFSDKSSKVTTNGRSEVEKGTNTSYIGPYLLKKARDEIALGGNSRRAFDLVHRAKKSFESSATEKPNLDYVMCLHLLASMHCNVNQPMEAITLLEQSIKVPNIKLGQNHALAKFVGCMRLGDIYVTMGEIEKAIDHYKLGFNLQKQVFGDKDPRFGETCRYVAEAYVQTFEFNEAEKLCKMALDIHKENGFPPSIEEAANRRLIGLICDSKGDFESALEHYIVASIAMHCNGLESDVAAVDSNIGHAYLALARYDEAVSFYKKALSSFIVSKGKDHPKVASVYIRLGELYNKIGKFGESSSYCEKALEIYNISRPYGTNDNNYVDDIANGLTELAGIYESMNELEQALKLLQKALEIRNEDQEGYQNCKIAGIEAQIGVIYYMLRNYEDSYNVLKRSISNFGDLEEKKYSLYGITLNQLGLTCVQLCAIDEAAELFDEARSILEKEYGVFHPDTLGVYSNLAGTYDALGRWDEAIKFLEFVVVMREEALGTADPIVDDEKRRLAELLNEAGKVRRRKSRSLKTLFDKDLQIHQKVNSNDLLVS